MAFYIGSLVYIGSCTGGICISVKDAKVRAIIFFSSKACEFGLDKILIFYPMPLKSLELLAGAKIDR